MVLLVHITSERNARRIRRAGLSAASMSHDRERRGVYCTPLMSDFTTAYQWSRELARRGWGPMAAVHFRISDDTRVTIGRYNDPSPQTMTAAQAVAHFMALEDPRGYELFLPRAVAPAEIRNIRALPRPIGWRYMPDAHGRRPCPCPACLGRGEYKAAHLRRRFPYDPPRRPRQQVLADLAEPRPATEIVALLDQLSYRGQADAFRLAHLVDHPDPAVRESLAYVLSGLRASSAAPYLEQLRTDPVAEVREAAGADDDEP